MDEHEVIRRVLSERRGHQRAVGRLLRGARSSFATTAASHAHFAPGSSSIHPGYEELVAARADSAAARAEMQCYKERPVGKRGCRTGLRKLYFCALYYFKICILVKLC